MGKECCGRDKQAFMGRMSTTSLTNTVGEAILSPTC